MKKRWDDNAALNDNLSKVLPRLTGKWFKAGNAALQPGVTWEQMHDFRLLTKRFRYTLEIVEPLYGPSLATRIRQLRKLQTLLGDINDAITTRALLSQAGMHHDGLDGELSARADRKTEELRRYWDRTFGAPGHAVAWKNYLARYAGRGAATKKP